jgi:flagellar biosynthetic protein FlhB
MADRSGKTEEPTQRRREKARKEGQFPSSKEFVAALQFIALIALLGAMGQRWLTDFRQTVRWMLEQAFAGEVTPERLTSLGWQVFRRNILSLAICGGALAVLTLALRLTTTRFGWSLKKLSPDPSRLNPLPRLQELPRQNLSALVQALILLPLFLYAVYTLARDRLEVFLSLPMSGVESGSAFVGSSLMELFWKAAGVFLVFGSVDLFRQMRRHNQELRMSRQEIRDEMTEMEGNPLIKSRIRRLQRDRARKQMMKEVPRATAVIVNPTHFAVAIRYHMETMAAPVVVAKRKNYLALRIRQRAMENQVPIIENPPLAQALYKAVDVGQEIPPHLYRAVAEILAYIFKLMKGCP